MQRKFATGIERRNSQGSDATAQRGRELSPRCRAGGAVSALNFLSSSTIRRCRQETGDEAVNHSHSVDFLPDDSWDAPLGPPQQPPGPPSSRTWHRRRSPSLDYFGCTPKLGEPDILPRKSKTGSTVAIPAAPRLIFRRAARTFGNTGGIVVGLPPKPGFGRGKSAAFECIFSYTSRERARSVRLGLHCGAARGRYH